jgi:hypothetical protein
MSFSNLLKLAAAQSQSILSQLQGAPASGKNFTYNTRAGAGVFGQAQVQEIMRPGGGTSRRVIIPLQVTRAQDFEFRSETTLIRTDLDITYKIVELNTHDPLFWGLGLIQIGPGHAQNQA